MSWPPPTSTHPVVPVTGYPPPADAAVVSPVAGRQRPWWGMGDIWLGLLFTIGVAIAATILAVILVTASGGDPLDPSTTVGVSAGVLAVSALGQQVAQGLWPIIVIKWKGRSRRDFGLAFRPIDLAYGIAGGIGGLVLAGIVGAVLTALVSLDDPNAADNSQFLAESRGSVWMWVLIFVTVVGAPVSEELFFRGLVLRAFQKRLGPLAALVLSTMLFTIMHFQGTSWEGLVVLFGTIGTVGAVLGALALLTGRLGASVVAHAFFNGVSVIAMLTADKLT